MEGRQVQSKVTEVGEEVVVVEKRDRVKDMRSSDGELGREGPDRVIEQDKFERWNAVVAGAAETFYAASRLSLFLHEQVEANLRLLGC